ncbi:glycosyltransferase family 4 protein, partial [Tritonibacter scottomollicae]|uniref:glycosyltransferase family 4 protein n=1 Tax=Tritonibacter scottomollicae TaxID=483013 RepID=UPI003AA85BB2
RKRWNLDTYHGARVLRLAAPTTKDVSYLRRTLGEWLMPHFMKRNLRKSPLSGESWDGVVWYSPSIFHAPLVRALKSESKCRSYLILRDIFPEWARDLGLLGPGPAYSFFKHTARQQYEAADVIGVQSPGNLGYFEQQRLSVAGQRLEVLQNWLAPPELAACSIDVSKTSLSGRKIFVYAGNMGVAQGLDALIELAARVRNRKDIGFLFVGRGSEFERLKSYCEQNRLDNIVFLGEIEPDEIPGLYSQCTAGLVALDGRHKSHNIPGKFVTYIQNGLPVLAKVNTGNDLAVLIREEGVGVACETGRIDDLLSEFDKFVDKIIDEPSIESKCKSLFDREFSASKAVEQIVAGLSCGDRHSR